MFWLIIRTEILLNCIAFVGSLKKGDSQNSRWRNSVNLRITFSTHHFNTHLTLLYCFPLFRSKTWMVVSSCLRFVDLYNCMQHCLHRPALQCYLRTSMPQWVQKPLRVEWGETWREIRDLATFNGLLLAIKKYYERFSAMKKSYETAVIRFELLPIPSMKSNIVS